MSSMMNAVPAVRYVSGFVRLEPFLAKNAVHITLTKHFASSVGPASKNASSMQSKLPKVMKVPNV